MNGTGPARFDPAEVPDLADPYPVYRRYREAGPVHPGSEAPPGPDAPATWYVFGHAEVAHVLTGRNFVRVRPGACAPPLVPDAYPVLRRVVENWLVFLDPPRHTRLRALVAPALTGSAVVALRPRIRRIAQELVAELAGRRVVDLVGDFAAPFPLLVISELLGVDGTHHAWFRDRALALQEAGSARAGRSPDGRERAERAARELADFFEEETVRRHGKDTGDLISALVRAAGEGSPPLSRNETVATCVHLLTAGHETTTSLLAKAVLALHAHPAARDELAARPALLPAAVDEFVRYDAPVQMVTRWAYEDTALGGYEIRAGDNLVLVLGAANRDPARFERPDTLDIHRDTVRHCGFGMGIHYCVGASLARAEAEIALTVLLEELPALRPGARPAVVVEYAPDWVFHGPSRVTLGMRSPEGCPINDLRGGGA